MEPIPEAHQASQISNIQPKSISESISKAFIQTYNLILFHSKCLDIIQSLSNALYYLPKDNLTILLNFEDYQIDNVNYFFEKIKTDLIFQKKDYFNYHPSIVNLRNIQKEKRRVIYENGGIVSLTSQILILDLLSKIQIRPQRINRIIIKVQNLIKNHFDILSWIVTYLKIQQCQATIILICRKPNLYAAQQRIQDLYRLFFCQRVVIWPFGRKQIYESILKIKDKFKEVQCKLGMPNPQKQIHEILINVSELIQKCHNKELNHGKLNSMEILCSVSDLQYNDNIINDIRDILDVKGLILSLLNLTSISFLLQFQRLIVQSKQYQVWKSSNTKLTQYFHSITQIAKKRIFHIKYVSQQSQRRVISLKNLLKLDQGEDIFYSMQFNLQFYFQNNLKMKEVRNLLDQLQSRYRQVFGSDVPDQQRIKVWIYAPNDKVMAKFHQFIFETIYQSQYLQFLREVYLYLNICKQYRETTIKRIIKTQSKKKSASQILEECQTILYQELFLEIESIFKLYSYYQQNYNITQQIDQQITLGFKSQLEKLNILYSDKDKIKLTPIYSPKDDLKYGCYLSLVITKNQNPTTTNQILRLIQPIHCIFLSPSVPLIRNLYIQFAQSNLLAIQTIHVFYFTNSIQQKTSVLQITKQETAFWQIAQMRSKIPKFNQNPFNRVEQLKIDDNLTKKSQTITLNVQSKLNKGTLIKMGDQKLFKVKSQIRTVLIDKRQFKSSLPSIIPIFLDSADYIISDQIAIEKKSLYTRDLQQSLRNNRLKDQLGKMSRKFSKPYLLIQARDIEQFSKESLSAGYVTVNGQKQWRNIYKQLIELMKSNKKVRMIWSTSLKKSCQIFKQLKKNNLQPNIDKFQPKNDQQFMYDSDNQRQSSQLGYTLENE